MNAWMQNATIALNVVADVVGNDINVKREYQPYVACRRALLAQREGLYIGAMKALVQRLTDKQRNDCRTLMMGKLQYVKGTRASLTSGAIL